MNDLSLFEDQSKNKAMELDEPYYKEKEFKILSRQTENLGKKNFINAGSFPVIFSNLNLFHVNLKTAHFNLAI